MVVCGHPHLRVDFDDVAGVVGSKLPLPASSLLSPPPPPPATSLVISGAMYLNFLLTSFSYLLVS